MKKKVKTYFISGHLDISQEEFKNKYHEKINDALKENGHFVVGDARGTDTLAQTYLFGKTKNVTVYHIKTSPLNNVGNFDTKGGYKTQTKKDAAMTNASDIDIAWVRSEEEQKKLYGKKYKKRLSGTAKNLRRRLIG